MLNRMQLLVCLAEMSNNNQLYDDEHEAAFHSILKLALKKGCHCITPTLFTVNPQISAL